MSTITLPIISSTIDLSMLIALETFINHKNLILEIPVLVMTLTLLLIMLSLYELLNKFFYLSQTLSNITTKYKIQRLVKLIIFISLNKK